MDYVALIIMLLSLFSLTIMYVTNEYYKRKEENSIPKPIDNNMYRVVECTIDDNKTFYVIEKYDFCNFTKKSSWYRVGRFEGIDFAIDMCERLNDKIKEELEEKRISDELDNTKNKKVIT